MRLGGNFFFLGRQCIAGLALSSYYYFALIRWGVCSGWRGRGRKEMGEVCVCLLVDELISGLNFSK